MASIGRRRVRPHRTADRVATPGRIGASAWRVGLVTLTVSLAALGCGAEPLTTGPGTGASAGTAADEAGTATALDPGAGGGSVPYCSRVPDLRPELEGNLPTGNLDPVLQGVLQTYADAHPEAFAGQWYARDSGGTFVLAFTGDRAAHLAAIHALRPSPDDHHVVSPPPSITATTSVAESGAAVDVVHADWSADQIEDWRRPVSEAVQPLGLETSSWNVIKNRITLGFASAVDLEDVATRLDGVVPPDVVCVDGIDPAVPTTTIARPTTMIPAEGSDPMVECVGATGRLSEMEAGIPIAEDDPLMIAFRGASIAGMPSTTSGNWLLLARSEDRATFILDRPARSAVSMQLTNGRWIWNGAGGGGCPPYDVVLPDGVDKAGWRLDPGFPAPGPASTELHVLVTERSCASGRSSADRIVGPEVAERDGTVLVAFGVRPPPGNGQTCQGNPSTPVVVPLPAPLGDRTLADGTTVPPAAPRASGG